MILLGVIGLFLTIAILNFVVSVLPDKMVESTDFANALADYEFYPVLDENIFEDPDYTEDMRKIMYRDGAQGYVLNESNLSQFDLSVNFMYDYINYIINGDSAGYNSCFSDAYNKKVYSKPDFTMQRLYDIELVKQKNYYDKDGNVVCVFKLDYKILKNDGTFRRDIDSSSSRTKTIYLSNREGRLAIDSEIILHVQHNEK